MGDLTSATFKIHRAHEHIQTLAQRIDSWLATEPYELVSEDTADGWRAGRLRLKTPPHPSLSLLAGDAMHNARSALDHAIYGLSTAPLRDRDALAFPLYRDRTRYEKAKKSGRWGELLVGVDQRFRDVVERSQPFRRGNGELGALAAFDNADKHRLVQVGYFGQSEPAASSVVLGKIGKLEFRSWPQRKRLVDGAEAYAFRARRVGTQAVGVKVHLSLAVVFGSRNLTILGLQAIVNRVGNVVLELMRVQRGLDVPLEARQEGGALSLVVGSPPGPDQS